VIDRARRASWLARDVPVAIAVDGAVAEDRLDLLFEESGGLVVVRVEAGAADAASTGLQPDSLARALGRPVREVLTLSLF
jgi:hypothetical protein